MIVDPRVQVTQPREAVRYGRDRQLARVDVVELVPADRGRNGPLDHAPDRVGARDRVVTGVLIEVDERLRGVTVLAPPDRRGVVRGAALDLTRKRERRAAHVGKAPPRLDPDVDVDAAAAGGLRPAGDLQFVEHLVCRVRDSLHAVKRAVGHRIDVDPPLVGPLDVGAARVPGMELDRRHLHRPDHARELGDAQLVGVAAVTGEGQPDGLHPVGGAGRDALLVHLVAVDPAREAMQHARPLPQRADDPVADADVVAREVELRLAASREVHPVRAREAHRAIADLELHRVVLAGGSHRLSRRRVTWRAA